MRPSQSPADGVVPVPFPLVSPPTVSSLMEVKYTGDCVVPAAVKVPELPANPAVVPSNLMIAPGLRVMAYVLTVTDPVVVEIIYGKSGSAPHVCALLGEP